MESAPNNNFSQPKIVHYFLKAFVNYAKFDGRATREEYWFFFLAHIVIAVITSFSPAIYTLYSLAAIVPGVAVACRRLHDVDKSGWFYLIPIYNLILLATEGNPNENMYGSVPGLEIAKEVTINDVIGKAKSMVGQANPQGNADEIAKLFELRKSGALSESEFESEKKKVMGL